MDPDPQLNPFPPADAAILIATRYMTCPCFEFRYHRTFGFLTPTLVSVIGIVLLLWDILLTFQDEAKYIWKLPVEFHKLVFLFNRYFVAGSMCFSVYSKFPNLSGCGWSYPRLQ